MFGDKNIILRYTPTARALEISGIALLMSVFFVVASMRGDVPEMAPRRFDMFGAVSEWGGSEVALLPALYALYIYLVVTGAGIMARRLAPSNDPASVLSVILTAVLWGKVFYLIDALIRVYSTYAAQDMPAFTALIMLCGCVAVGVISAIIILKKFCAGKEGGKNEIPINYDAY